MIDAIAMPTSACSVSVTGAFRVSTPAFDRRVLFPARPSPAGTPMIVGQLGTEERAGGTSTAGRLLTSPPRRGAYRTLDVGRRGRLGDDRYHAMFAPASPSS